MEAQHVCGAHQTTSAAQHMHNTTEHVQGKTTARGSPTKSKKKMPKMPAGWSFVSVRQRLLDAVCLARTDTDTAKLSKTSATAALAAYPLQPNPRSVSVQGVRSAAGSDQGGGTHNNCLIALISVHYLLKNSLPSASSRSWRT